MAESQVISLVPHGKLIGFIGPKRLLLSMVNTAAASSGVWSQLAVGTRQGRMQYPAASISSLSALTHLH